MTNVEATLHETEHEHALSMFQENMHSRFMWAVAGVGALACLSLCVCVCL